MTKTYRIRPTRATDLDDLLRLAELTGYGVTTLPPERDLLQRRVQKSLQAFAQIIHEPAGQTYLFVMEEMESGEVLGITGIASKVGGFQPFYSYELLTERFKSASLKLEREIQVLKLVEDHNGPSEIGSLFLHPDYVGKGMGSLLSKCRFLFIASHPKLFEDTILAEMRGVVDHQGCSPFWDALGVHFFGMDFPTADRLSVRNKAFIKELMPRHPIYVPTLSLEAQKVLAQVHPQTVPALKMLEAEGFAFNGMVDIFDGGPVVACARDQIRTVRESLTAVVVETNAQEDEGFPALLGNTRVDYRSCFGPMTLIEPGKIRLNARVAAALEIQPGDEVRYVGKRAKEPA